MTIVGCSHIFQQVFPDLICEMPTLLHFYIWSVHCPHWLETSKELLKKTHIDSQDDQSSWESKDVGSAESQNKSESRSLLSRTPWTVDWMVCLLRPFLSCSVCYQRCSKQKLQATRFLFIFSVGSEMHNHKLYLQYLSLRCFILL